MVVDYMAKDGSVVLEERIIFDFSRLHCDFRHIQYPKFEFSGLTPKKSHYWRLKKNFGLCYSDVIDSGVFWIKSLELKKLLLYRDFTSDFVEYILEKNYPDDVKDFVLLNLDFIESHQQWTISQFCENVIF